MTDDAGTLENRVRFEETDLQGIVFYGNYFTYMDVVHNEHLRQLEAGPGSGWSEHVVHVDMDYRGQATFDDVLVNRHRFSSIGDSSMETEYRCLRKADGELLAEGGAIYVAVDDDTGDTVRVPDAFRESVVASQADPPDPV